MAIVTAVWEQEPHPRTADDILIRLRRDPEGRTRQPRSKKAPRPQNKRVAASVIKNNAEGVAAMFDEAELRNPDGARQNVVLLDGDKNQLANVDAEAKARGMPITIVFDVIHVIHYLWRIAILLCDNDRKAADRWIASILKQLLTRHPLDVVVTIRQTATNRKLPAAERADMESALDYLRKNSLYIHYARFLAAGLPIATGVIEGACRYLASPGSDGNHRSALGSRERRGCPEAPRPSHQCRLGRVLAISSRAGALAKYPAAKLAACSSPLKTSRTHGRACPVVAIRRRRHSFARRLVRHPRFGSRV